MSVLHVADHPGDGPQRCIRCKVPLADLSGYEPAYRAKLAGRRLEAGMLFTVADGGREKDRVCDWREAP